MSEQRHDDSARQDAPRLATDGEAGTSPPFDRQTPEATGGAGGFDTLAEADRVEYRLLPPNKQWTGRLDALLRADLDDYRRDNARADGKPYPLSRLSEQIGQPHSSLSEWLRGKYRGSCETIARSVDEFLATERARRGRVDFRRHAQIAISKRIFTVLNFAAQNGSMAAVVGPPGVGKTAAARAYQLERGGVLLVRIKDEPCDSRKLSAALCKTIKELRPVRDKTHPQRVDALERWFSKRRNTILITDESQKLDRSALELLRDFHDTADPDGNHGLPIIFIGDENFHRLLVRTRDGVTTPISPQLVRRINPLLDIAKDCGIEVGGDGGPLLYSPEDIVRIVGNDRVRLLTPEAVRWLTDLANLIDFGALGLAMEVLRTACQLMQSRDAQQVDVEMLRTSLNMSAGRSAAAQLDQAAGGMLLAAKVG